MNMGWINNLNCCHLAFFLAVIILFLIPVSFNYSLKLNQQQIELKKEVRDIEIINGKELKRIEELEKKNGHELDRIKQLENRLEQLEKKG